MFVVQNSGAPRDRTYTYADWVGSFINRMSKSGYCTFVGGNLVTLRSKKQNVVATSSVEGEFRLVSFGIYQELWIKKLLDDMRIPNPLPMKLYYDNKAAILVAHNPMLHDRKNHVGIDKHFLQKKFESGMICMPYIPTGEQIADVFTKGFPTKQFY